MLGPAFSQKSLISPIVKMHLFGLYTCPITRSGLGSMALKDTHLSPLDIFHRKCLRSFLSLSSRSPTPALYFLLSEIPMSAKIHRDLFSIFFSIWSNPNTKLHEIVKYLLKTLLTLWKYRMTCISHHILKERRRGGDVKEYAE